MHKSATENFLPPLLLFLLQQIWYFCNLKLFSGIHFLSLSLYGKNAFFNFSLNLWAREKLRSVDSMVKQFYSGKNQKKYLKISQFPREMKRHGYAILTPTALKTNLDQVTKYSFFFFFLFAYTNNPVTIQQCIWEFTSNLDGFLSVVSGDLLAKALTSISGIQVIMLTESKTAPCQHTNC